eukprot:12629938-Alexandrium_andersonii.AAC.1
MSASLVGSEMCIRDSLLEPQLISLGGTAHCCGAAPRDGENHTARLLAFDTVENPDEGLEDYANFTSFREAMGEHARTVGLIPWN